MMKAEIATPNSSEHGGNIYRVAEELGIPDDKLIDFSASINPLGISGKVKTIIKKEMRNLVHYPDPDTKMLRERLSEYHDIDHETVICGCGSTELIYLIPRALKPESVLVPAPTFSEYERAVRISNGSRVMSYELREENNFSIITDKFISAIERLSFNSKLRTLNSKLVFLCNPNNPTGHLLKREEVLRIADAARDTGCMLIVDEAFIDFCPDESVIREVRHNPYLIVLRSMTKFYALTGLRIGYGVFPGRLLSRIKEYKEPWTVNNLAQKAAIAALEDNEYLNRTSRLMKEEKDFLEKGFKKVGIEFYPSDANYYLLNVGARRVIPLLTKKGILVRDCSNFKGLGGSYIRVAVKSRKHNRMLLKELENILNLTLPLAPSRQGRG